MVLLQDVFCALWNLQSGKLCLFLHINCFMISTFITDLANEPFAWLFFEYGTFGMSSVADGFETVRGFCVSERCEVTTEVTS